MSISRRRFTAAALAGLAGGLPLRMRASGPRPKLFIFLISEQFRPIYLERNASRFVTGGFRELMTNGVYYRECQLGAAAFTGSGLATLVTGAHPQLHGIVADRWYDHRAKSTVEARGELLEATTLADELQRREDGRIFCLGLQESHTSVLAGRSRAQTYWMDEQGQFSTRGNLPEWLLSHNQQHPIENLHGKKWVALDGGDSDLPPIRTLTYDARHPEEFMALYQASPYAQDAQCDLLLELLAEEKAGQGDTTDFIFVALGAMALLGYETGSDSKLMDQMVLSLDRRIKGILDWLKAKIGKNNYNLIFAGSHGAPPLPQDASRARRAIAGESIARTMNQALSDWIDKGPAKNIYVEKYVYPFLYLRQEVLRKQNVSLRGARNVAAQAALRYPGVAGYYTADGACSHSGDWRRRFENSFNEIRSGDVMLSYGAEIMEEYGSGRGVSYGSLYNYDTHVPLILYGPQFGRKRIERAIDAVDLAPTVAAAAGIEAPSSTTGGILVEAFADASDDERSK